MTTSEVFSLIKRLYSGCGIAEPVVRHEHTNRFGDTLVEVEHPYRSKYLQIVYNGEQIKGPIFDCWINPDYMWRYNSATEISNIEQLQKWAA